MTMDYTEADADSLTTKLDALDLTPGQRAALVAVFVAATDKAGDEVSGFSYQLALDTGCPIGVGATVLRSALESRTSDRTTSGLAAGALRSQCVAERRRCSSSRCEG